MSDGYFDAKPKARERPKPLAKDRFKRLLEAQVRVGLRDFPVVVLLGPRQVGKTTLAKQILGKGGFKKASVYLDLEMPSDLARIQDPQAYLETVEDRLVVLDEVQRQPETFPVLRALVDRKRRSGRFLLLGSASPHLLRESSESLAGRVLYLELQPLLLPEVGRKVPLEKHWWRGGYPQSLLKSRDGVARLWLDSLIQTYLERDFPQAGVRVRAVDLRRFWTMLAHEQGQLLNAEKLGAGLGVKGPTIRHYLSILESAFLIRQLRPWHMNFKKRLVKAPKVFVRDYIS